MKHRWKRPGSRMSSSFGLDIVQKGEYNLKGWCSCGLRVVQKLEPEEVIKGNRDVLSGSLAHGDVRCDRLWASPPTGPMK
jgi:hypothetical protein